MAKLVTFKGRAQHLPNDSHSNAPIYGVWYVGARPRFTYNPTTGNQIVPAYTSLIFDRALAEAHGRSCGGSICEGDCDGDCFAALHVAALQVGNEGEEVFTVEDVPPPPPPPKPPKPDKTDAANAVKE